MAARDPIISPPATSSGSPKNTSADRIKSVSGGGANYSGERSGNSAPAPNSPYGKR